MGKLLLLAFGLCCFNAASAETTSSGINWTYNYDQAASQAKNTGKPMLLFFTGTGWCSWCTKLENEVLDTAEFGRLVGDKFIFVKLDFPMSQMIDPRNKQLQQQFDVKGYPTIIILDKDGQRIGSSGYRPGGARAYADYLLNIINDYGQYRKNVTEADKKKLSARDLKKLYEKATELERNDEASHLVSLGIKMGVQKEEKPFFLIEKYRLLAQEGKIHGVEAEALKKDIISHDPQNKFGSQYDLAVIEFDAYSDEMAKENYAPEIAVEPLVKYIENFGAKDPDHLWKLQMIISQVFLEKNKYAKALEYAQASYKTAPQPIKSEIGIAVSNLQKELK